MKSLKTKLIAILAVVMVGGAVACTSAQVKQAEELIGIVLNALPNFIPLFSSSTVAVADANKAIADFKVASNIINEYEASDPVGTAEKVNALLTDAQTNLSGIVAVAGLSGATAAKVQAGVALTISTVQEVEAVIGVPQVTPAAKLGRVLGIGKAKIQMPKPKDLQKKYDSILAGK